MKLLKNKFFLSSKSTILTFFYCLYSTEYMKYFMFLWFAKELLIHKTSVTSYKKSKFVYHYQPLLSAETSYTQTALSSAYISARSHYHLAGNTVFTAWLSREAPPVGLSLLI